MSANDLIREAGGLHRLMLRPCTTAILPHIVDPTVPFVWIRRHMPEPALRWWSTMVPLASTRPSYEIRVRSMEFDILFETHQFLDVLPEFEDQGIVLLQMSKPVPDTLTIDRIPENAIDRVLMENGLHLRFYLPHALECAELATPDREVLVRMLGCPEISGLAFR